MSNRSDLESRLLKIDETIAELSNEMVRLHAARLPDIKNLEEARFHLVQEWSETWTRLKKLPATEE